MDYTDTETFTTILDRTETREKGNCFEDFTEGDRIEHAPGLTEWDGEAFDDSMRKAKRIYPHHNDTGGFFCAKLEVCG